MFAKAFGTNGNRDGKNANFSLSLVIVISIFKKSLFIFIYFIKIVSYRQGRSDTWGAL